MGVLIPKLEGGLGDNLFQVAAAVKLASGSGNKYALFDGMLNGASRFLFSKMFIFSGAFMIGKKITHAYMNAKDRPSYEKCVEFFARYSNTKLCVYLHGSLQTPEFIPKQFNEMVTLPAVGGSLEALSCFIHIDKECTDNYYSRSVPFIRDKHGIKKFVVFGDINVKDVPKWLEGIDYQIINYNEAELLARMVRCKAGIASTSALSWWGAYLNPNRPICMPSNFPKAEHSPWYFFPGAYVVPV